MEVLIVVAIGLVVTAIGLPVFSTMIANMKLRSSMTSVSGLLQNCRMVAVQQNKTKTALNFNRSTAPYSLIYYVKDAGGSTTLFSQDPQVEMEAPISTFTTPSGANAPAGINTSLLGFTPETTDPSFNSTGLPCAYSSGTCTNKGFVKYFKDNRIAGSGGWAAITISPAGRIKRWFWDGSSWIE